MFDKIMQGLAWLGCLTLVSFFAVVLYMAAVARSHPSVLHG